MFANTPPLARAVSIGVLGIALLDPGSARAQSTSDPSRSEPASQLTHRLNGNLRRGSVGGRASNLFGLDQGAVEVQRRSLAAEELVASLNQRGSSRDTLRNGAIIGAVAGAVGLGALGAFICNQYQEEGGASCLADTLRGAAIGAAIGTGAGVAVDAALTRQAGVTVRIGVKF